MTTRFLSPEELHQRLLQHGHSLWPDAKDEASTMDVWPPPEIIITIALGTDGTLRPVYRERYFVCVTEEEDGEPMLYHEAAFDLPRQFTSALALEPIRGYFMLGPMRWLFVRLGHLPKVLLWPKDEYRQPDGTWFFQDWERNQVQLLQQCLSEVTSNKSSTGAIVLDMEDLHDSRVLWQVANFVAASYHDFFLSDLDCHEVYVLHHHDKVVISIPDHGTRHSLLMDLNQHAHVLVDSSGYTSKVDAEFESDKQ